MNLQLALPFAVGNARDCVGIEVNLPIRQREFLGLDTERELVTMITLTPTGEAFLGRTVIVALSTLRSGFILFKYCFRVQVFMAVQKAFETLTDTTKRRAYDSSLEFDDSIPGGSASTSHFRSPIRRVFLRDLKTESRTRIRGVACYLEPNKIHFVREPYLCL